MANKFQSSRLHKMSVVACALSMVGIGATQAMPIETDTYTDIPGVNDTGQLDIREVLDNASEMEIRLTRQIMLLQRQINDLQLQIEDMQDAQ